MSELLRQIAHLEFHVKWCFTDWPDFNPIALRKAKIAYNFGLSECSSVKFQFLYSFTFYLGEDRKSGVPCGSPGV